MNDLIANRAKTEGKILVPVLKDLYIKFNWIKMLLQLF